MITWLDTPFKGTNHSSGFEILIHGFQQRGDFTIDAICVNENGTLERYPIECISLDWRYTRGKGWHSIDDPEPEA